MFDRMRDAANRMRLYDHLEDDLNRQVDALLGHHTPVAIGTKGPTTTVTIFTLDDDDIERLLDCLTLGVETRRRERGQ